jgi:hypothetical protein
MTGRLIRMTACLKLFTKCGVPDGPAGLSMRAAGRNWLPRPEVRMPLEHTALGARRAVKPLCRKSVNYRVKLPYRAAAEYAHVRIS